MTVLTKSKQSLKKVIAGASAVALLAAPASALAHGGGGRGGDDGQSNQNNRPSVAQQRSDTHNGWGQTDHGRDGDKNKNDNDARFRKQQADKQKTCDEQQAAINQRAANTTARFTKKLNGLNIVYGGIQTYVASGDVNVPNYDALNNAAATSQANATAAVGAIQAPTVNCDDSSSYGAANATLDQTTQNAFQALTGYRQDVMQLFNAVLES